MALDGPAGSGKTFTAMRFAMVLAEGVGRVAVISTEPGAPEKYIGENPDGIPFDFDVCELTDFSPTTFTDKILEAGRAGYAVIIVDSLSHAWQGALEIIDKAKGGFTDKEGWRRVTPMHNRLVDSVLRSPAHIIATMRTKTEYVIEQETRPNGQIVNVPKKIGLKPIQREGMEYEFDVVGDVDRTHTLTIDKTRCSLITDAIVVRPGRDFIVKLRDWLNEGAEPPVGTYTTDVNQLAGSQDLAQQREDAIAEAAREQARQHILAATGVAIPGVAAAPAAVSPTAVATPVVVPVEQPPFDGGSVPAASVPAPAATAPAAPAATAPATAAPTTATIEQCQELAQIGAILGRSIQDIGQMCQSQLNCLPQDLSYSQMAMVLDAFRAEAATVQQAPAGQAQGNPTQAA